MNFKNITFSFIDIRILDSWEWWGLDIFFPVQIFPHQNYEAFKHRSLCSSTKTPLHKLVSDCVHEFDLNLHCKSCRYRSWTLIWTLKSKFLNIHFKILIWAPWNLLSLYQMCQNFPLKTFFEIGNPVHIFE